MLMLFYSLPLSWHPSDPVYLHVVQDVMVLGFKVEVTSEDYHFEEGEKSKVLVHLLEVSLV